jgi:DNA repair protein RecO (recombination protein O)
MSSLPPNRHPFEAEAFVLKHYNYQENDRIIVLFSREHGILRALARGVRKTTRNRIGGNLDLLRCNHLTLERGAQLHKIIQGESLLHFPGLHRDYHVLIHALALADLINTFCQEEDPQPYLFSLLLHTLESLSQGFSPLLMLIWFELRLLEHLGYEQDWNFCRICGQAFQDRDYHFWDIRSGGLRCERCKQPPDSRFIRREQVNGLRQLQNSADIPEPLTLPAQALPQLQTYLQEYLEHLAEKPIKALGFVCEELETQRYQGRQKS